MTDLARAHRRLAAAMDRRGDWPTRSPWIRQAVDALPRHLFAADRLWQWDGYAWAPVDRGSDAERWAALVYAGPDDPAVTQVTDDRPSSSLSCQAVVADMLDSLLLEPGHQVLELGTGTGWNAALLAWRAGPGRVTSVEADPELAETAAARLAEAGAKVDVRVGDGAAGWPPGAPFDRVIATYAVERVPWAWVEQTRPGGRIVTPWGRLGHVALTVAADGRSADGWMQGLAQFMPARGSGTGVERGWQQVRGSGPADAERITRWDLRPLRGNVHLLFALRVQLPDVRISTGVDADGVNAWLHDGASSWAALSAVGDGRTVVHQGGPRRLADEVEQAWEWWRSAGEPDLYDFGMTVRPDEQFVWCTSPSGPRWPQPRSGDRSGPGR